MKLEERLVKNSRMKPAGDPYYAAEPDWMEYKPREKQPYLNENKGVFANEDKTSINTAPDVFEATAVFKMKKTKETNPFGPYGSES